MHCNRISVDFISDTHELMQDIKDVLLRFQRSPDGTAIAKSHIIRPGHLSKAGLIKKIQRK